jgi:hypothetical protein
VGRPAGRGSGAAPLLTAADALGLLGLLRPRTAIPVHYEGWKHFQQGRDAIEREFASAPEEIPSSVLWLPIGEPVESPRPARTRRGLTMDLELADRVGVVTGPEAVQNLRASKFGLRRL